MSIKLAIFDCDGVLVDTERLQAQSYSEVLQPFGVHLDAEEASREFAGMSLDTVVNFLQTKFSITLPDNFTQTYRARMKEIFQEELKPIDGITDLLKQLQLPKCVASNGPQEKMQFTLKLTGLDTFFPAENIFSAYDINSFKPDPGLYLHAAKQMGFAANECIVLEDSRPGITAAIAAGMKGVFFNPHGDFSSVEDLNVHACIKETADFKNYCD